MRKFIGLSFNALGQLGAIQQSSQEQNMNRRNIAQLSVVTALLTLVSGSILAQQQALKDQLVGSWILVSASQMTKDGKKSDRWGPGPKGFAVFEANGRYSFMIYRSDVPKFASANPNQASADEAKAAIRGMTAHYGTWSIDEATKTLTTNIEAGSVPNLNGSNQKRIISSVTADELRYTNPASQIGTVDEVVWKRVR